MAAIRDFGVETADGGSKNMAKLAKAFFITKRIRSLTDLEEKIGLFKKNNGLTLWNLSAARED
jgi:hypothetical protein